MPPPHTINVQTSAWFGAGALCIGRYAGKDEMASLLAAGIANATDEAAAKKYGFGPCLRVPALDAAFVVRGNILFYFRALGCG